MPYKDPAKARLCARRNSRRRNNSEVVLPPITRERILEETIVHDDYVEAPLHNYKYELVAYTKIDIDVWEKLYKGERLNLSNHGYARFKSDFVHYNVIGKPDSRWIFIDHIIGAKMLGLLLRAGMQLSPQTPKAAMVFLARKIFAMSKGGRLPLGDTLASRTGDIVAPRRRQNILRP